MRSVVADAPRNRAGLMALFAATLAMTCALLLCAAVLLTSSAGLLVRTPIGIHIRASAPDLGAQAMITATAQANDAVTAATTARQLRIFRQLWTIVNERYVYPDFNGYDWRAARDELNARIAAGMTDAQFHEALSDLIVALNDEHSSFLSPQDAEAEDAEYSGNGTYVGVGLITDVNPDARHIYILSVLPNSPAEQAGLRPHDHILQIGGQPSVDADGNSQSFLLRGDAGTTVDLIVRTPGQDPRPIQVTRGQVNSSERIEQRVLTDTASGKRIGYLLVPSLFEESIAPRARRAMRDLMRAGNLDGLILDLRTNGGGSYPNLRGILGMFTGGTMGNLVNRDGARTAIRARAERIGNSQTVPMVVLIGSGTESFAEVLAGALQARGRAVLIGQNTAGNIETLLSHEFEDGSRLWLAEESFQLPDGTSWELVGLTPDVRIDAAWDEFTADNDPVIAAAVARLKATR
jgi:C-terminal peptidase prc